ncbi:hypothetical protein M501DRAFT_942995 [Patellaria atrata CBS 101060]|uniref:WIBG Mago-binding domain-containing protein n=1 Tax=Patellaria atrata CBS 101060 TaxID=1346257 RepID=A0A9P4S275_9PEZI|nr:hypothetical protein M501DRAFT_942995 [Patellaria atrata CBS 101060]
MTMEPTNTSKSGIQTSPSGSSFIPSSTRADGSVRKEIRVRPGYKPPEDVEVYKNRTAEAWKNRGSGGIPGAESLRSSTGNEKSGASNKNAKRREARKRAAAVNAEQTGEDSGNADARLRPPQPNAQEQPQAVSETEKEKSARKLMKKLRQARDLKDKKEQGGALLPEQFEKVIKINELIRQLDSLGFDSQGEKKSVTEEKGTTFS